MKKDENIVKVMTVHQAKGLEFRTVFMVGMMEGEFPVARALLSAEGLEEERRICYVGMTRALERLFLTYSQYRNQSKSHLNRPSRFLREMVGA